MTNRNLSVVKGLFLLLFSLITTKASPVKVIKPFGIQSKEVDSGNSYAGSMIYDKNHNVVILTGTTYGVNSNVSNCFMSILQLPGGDDGPDEPFWMYKEVIGENDNKTKNNEETITTSKQVDTVCSSMIGLSTTDNSKRILIGGSTEEGGILTSLRKAGSNRATQYGIALDLSLELEDEKLEDNVITTSTLLGGRLFHSSAIQAIRDIVAGSANSNVVYAVSEESDSSLQSSSPISSVVQPNLLDNSKYYGAHKNRDMFLRLEQLPRKSADEIITDDTNDYMDTLDRRIWTREIDMGSEMRVAGLDLVPSTNTLILAYSVLEQRNTQNDNLHPDNDVEETWNGYITLLDAANGITKNTIKIESQEHQNDIIHGYCRSPMPDESGEVAFIVGTTTGHFNSKNITKSGQRTAFLARISLSSGINEETNSNAFSDDDEATNDDDDSFIQVDWYIQITSREDAPGDMVGTKCVVTNDGKQVYVGGTIYDGAILKIDDDASESANKNTTTSGINKGNDIWMGQIDTSRHLDASKNWNWLVQLGSDDGDESLSSLDVDQANDLLVFGHTDGSFLRQKQQHEQQVGTKNTMDVFVLSLLRISGQFVDIMSQGDNDDSNNNGPTKIPYPPTPPPNTPGAHVNDDKTDIPPRPGISTATSKSSNLLGNFVTLLFGLFLAICILLGCTFLYHTNRLLMSRRNIEKYITEIEDDDEVDVDIKRSATGGFHGVYINHDGGLRYFASQTDVKEDSGAASKSASFVISDDDDDDEDDFALLESNTNSATAAAIVNEALFSLDDTTAATNSNNTYKTGALEYSNEKGNKGNSYSGLVHAYDSTWEDLSQHKLPRGSSRRKKHRNHSLVDVDINHAADLDDDSPWGKELI